MAEGRAREEWDHTAPVLAMLANAHRDHRQRSEPFGVDDFHPFRALRRTDRTLSAALTGPAPQLPATLGAPLKRVRAVLAAAARSHRSHHDPRYTLWQAWDRSGLQRRWVSAADRGGADGALAERSLGAVTALFDITEGYVARTAGASLSGLLEHVAALQLPPAAADAAPAH